VEKSSFRTVELKIEIGKETENVLHFLVQGSPESERRGQQVAKCKCQVCEMKENNVVSQTGERVLVRVETKDQKVNTKPGKRWGNKDGGSQKLLNT